MLTLALPTGRILTELLDVFERAGIPVPQEEVKARKLRISNGAAPAMVLVKDRDVPTYVEHGVADAGVVGRDVLAEVDADIYQPLDLGVGRCRMVVARRKEEGPAGYRELPVVRVATKYPQVAAQHFHGRGIPIELIPLSGSVEVAPLLGLADCIVDVVATGRTLAANGLVVDHVLFESSAQLIANRASFRLKRDEMSDLIRQLGREAQR
jgi:ATP phosphoribosyltransferase